MLFEKGKSGNPGGRPRFERALRDAGFDPKEVSAELVKRLVEAVRGLDPNSASWRFAVRELCDRRWGKPKEHLDVTVDNPRDVDIAAMTDEQLALLAAIGVRATERDPDDDGAPGGQTEH